MQTCFQIRLVHATTPLYNLHYVKQLKPCFKLYQKWCMQKPPSYPIVLAITAFCDPLFLPGQVLSFPTFSDMHPLPPFTI